MVICHSLFLASVKSRLVFPFWYRLTWVVPEKGPLNRCVCVCVYVCVCVMSMYFSLKCVENFQSEPARPAPSESSSFRSLRFQELFPFRTAIESENVEAISKMMSSNPRYLIGSGDNPTILHVCTVFLN